MYVMRPCPGAAFVSWRVRFNCHSTILPIRKPWPCNHRFLEDAKKFTHKMAIPFLRAMCLRSRSPRRRRWPCPTGGGPASTSRTSTTWGRDFPLRSGKYQMLVTCNFTLSLFMYRVVQLDPVSLMTMSNSPQTSQPGASQEFPHPDRDRSGP